MVQEKLALARQEKLMRTFAPSTSFAQGGTRAAVYQTFDMGSYFEGGGMVRPSRGIKRKKEQTNAYTTKSAKNKKTTARKNKQRIVSDDEDNIDGDEDNIDGAEEEGEENKTEEVGEEEEEEEGGGMEGQREGEEEQEEGSVDSVEEVSVRRQTKKQPSPRGWSRRSLP